MKPERVQDHFVYESPHDIAAATRHQVMPLPPHPPDPGVPLFWAAWRDDFQYLVNDSGETLPSVVVETGGFETTELGALTKQGEDTRYESVQPGEAVKIDFFDEMEDGIVQVLTRVESPSWGLFQVNLMRRAHTMSGTIVVLWDTGQKGRHAGIRWNPPAS